MSRLITVTSAAFSPGGPIPTRYTCRGAGERPPLAWSGVPADAQALAVVVDDPDAPGGTFTHWVVTDLPADTTGLAGPALPATSRQARNSAGRVGWYPPCPPSGTHHYRFTVYALTRSLHLPDGGSLHEALRAVGDAATATGRLVGTVAH